MPSWGHLQSPRSHDSILLYCFTAKNTKYYGLFIVPTVENRFCILLLNGHHEEKNRAMAVSHMKDHTLGRNPNKAENMTQKKETIV